MVSVIVNVASARRCSRQHLCKPKFLAQGTQNSFGVRSRAFICFYLAFSAGASGEEGERHFQPRGVQSQAEQGRFVPGSVLLSLVSKNWTLKARFGIGYGVL